MQPFSIPSAPHGQSGEAAHSSLFTDLPALGQQLVRQRRKLEYYYQIVMALNADMEGMITDASEALCRVSGYTQSELVGQNHALLFHHDTLGTHAALMQNVVKEETIKAEMLYRSKTGKIFRLNVLIFFNRNENGTLCGYTALHEDITDRNSTECLCMTDELTGLCNRRKLEMSVKHKFADFKRYEQNTSLLIFDIDHFKTINNTYGRDIGDDLLKEIANLLQTSLRETDIKGRRGSDEFLILLTHTDIYGAKQLAEHIRDTIEHHPFIQQIKITVSIGITQFTPDDMDFEASLERVDSALYNAKNSGRNTISVI